MTNCKICKKELKNKHSVANHMRGHKSKRTIRKDGYVLSFQPTHPNNSEGRYVLEHRIVMEKEIGRYLTRWEVVHHINGVNWDNRIENLKMFVNNAEHLKEEAKLKREGVDKSTLLLDTKKEVD